MITLDLNVGAPKPLTSSGVPGPDGVLRAENGAFLILEDGNFLAFDI
jgi:hypothetical protein